MPFVYSKNNKDVERLSKGPHYTHERICKRKEACGLCMPWTILEVSWTRTDDDYYAFTRLGKIKLEHINACIVFLFFQLAKRLRARRIKPRVMVLRIRPSI